MDPLSVITKDASFIGKYTIALSNLWASGIFNFLRAKGLPKVIGMGSDQSIMATQAAWSAGYNEALDDIINFADKYLTPQTSIADVPMDFGATALALARGDITEEEANDLRTNSKSNI